MEFFGLSVDVTITLIIAFKNKVMALKETKVFSGFCYKLLFEVVFECLICISVALI